jgi:transposase
MPKLSRATRGAIVRHYQGGARPSEIQKMMTHREVSLTTICKVIKRWGDEPSGSTFGDHPRSGRPRSVRSEDWLRELEQEITRDPQTSLKALARQFDVNLKTMKKAVKKDLGYNSLPMQTGPGLSNDHKRKRLELSPVLLEIGRDYGWENILWSDEKNFCFEPALNKQNTRYIAKSRADVPKVPRNKFPKKLMVWAGISARGKTRLVFFTQGTRMNSDDYINEVLTQEVMDAGETIFGGAPWIFQQDGASVHRSKKVLKWFDDNNIDVILPDQWPPNSPDLSPLDFSIWHLLESKAWNTKPKSLQQFKQVSHLRFKNNEHAIRNEILRPWWLLGTTYRW